MCVCMCMTYFTKISKWFVLTAFPCPGPVVIRSRHFEEGELYSICAIGVSGLSTSSVSSLGYMRLKGKQGMYHYVII